MIDLAIFSVDKQVALKDVAERQNVSLKYLEQEFSLLKRAGLVRSIKGSKGGYILARSADEMQVGEIIRALEGDLLVIDIDTGTSSEIRAFLNQAVWEPLNQSVETYLDSLSLSTLAETFIEKENKGGMFYI
jgi:Rrf2 family protein